MKVKLKAIYTIICLVGCFVGICVLGADPLSFIAGGGLVMIAEFGQSLKDAL